MPLLKFEIDEESTTSVGGVNECGGEVKLLMGEDGWSLGLGLLRRSSFRRAQALGDLHVPGAALFSASFLIEVLKARGDKGLSSKPSFR